MNKLFGHKAFKYLGTLIILAEIFLCGFLVCIGYWYIATLVLFIIWDACNDFFEDWSKEIKNAPK